MLRFQLSACLCAILFLLQAGCGSDGPELGYVEGTVKLDGKPLPNVVLTFQPQKARPSYGKTDAEGKYHLVYTDELDGAVLGSHIVSISSADAGGGGEYEGDYEEDSSYEKGKDYENTGNESEARGEKVPAKFNKNTELTREVKAGDNVIDFDLSSTD